MLRHGKKNIILNPHNDRVTSFHGFVTLVKHDKQKTKLRFESIHVQ